MIQTSFRSSLEVFGNLRKSLEVFGNFRKMFGNIPLAFGTNFFNLWKVVRNLKKIAKKSIISMSIDNYNKKSITFVVATQT